MEGRIIQQEIKIETDLSGVKCDMTNITKISVKKKLSRSFLFGKSWSNLQFSLRTYCLSY